MLKGKEWNERNFNWTQAIQAIKDVNEKGPQSKRPNDEDKANEIDGLVDESSTLKVTEAYKGLLFEIINIITQTNDSMKVEKEIDDVIKFESKLDIFTRKYKAYIKQTDAKLGTKKRKKNVAKGYYRDIVWLNLFQTSVFRNVTLYDEPVGEEIIHEFADFLKNTPPRFAFQWTRPCPNFKVFFKF